MHINRENTMRLGAVHATTYISVAGNFGASFQPTARHDILDESVSLYKWSASQALVW